MEQPGKVATPSTGVTVAAGQVSLPEGSPASPVTERVTGSVESVTVTVGATSKTAPGSAALGLAVNDKDGVAVVWAYAPGVGTRAVSRTKEIPADTHRAAWERRKGVAA